MPISARLKATSQGGQTSSCGRRQTAAAVRCAAEKRRLPNRGGFTLFELLVVITIVALIMGVVVGRVNDYLDIDMKKTVNKMSSTMRYLYNKAVTEGIYLRLVMDLTEQSYWVEATREPFIIMTEEGEGKQEARSKKPATKASAGKQEARHYGAGGQAESEKQETKNETEKSADKKSAEKGELPKLKLKEPVFSQVEAYLLRPTRLPDTVFFKDVMTEHAPDPQDGGKAYIYFFPNGYVEHAIINFRNEDDDFFYSLETNPIIGTVKIENEYKTLEKE